MPTRKPNGQGNANPEVNDVAIIMRLGLLMKSLCLGGLAALIDDAALKTGVRLEAYVAMDYLSGK